MGIWYSNIVGRAAKCLYIARAITRLVDGNSGIFLPQNTVRFSRLNCKY